MQETEACAPRPSGRNRTMSHVWIIEFQSFNKEWLPSRDYCTPHFTKREAVNFLKNQRPQRFPYRVVKYEREKPNPRSD